MQDLEVQNLELHRKIAKLIMSKDLAQPNRPLKAQINTPSSDLVQLPNGIVPTCSPYVDHIQPQKRQIKSSHDSKQTGLISPRTPEARVESESTAVLLETPQGTQVGPSIVKPHEFQVYMKLLFDILMIDLC